MTQLRLYCSLPNAQSGKGIIAWYDVQYLKYKRYWHQAVAENEEEAYSRHSDFMINIMEYNRTNKTWQKEGCQSRLRAKSVKEGYQKGFENQGSRKVFGTTENIMPYNIYKATFSISNKNRSRQMMLNTVFWGDLVLITRLH